uniref:RNA-directed DNA polymerase n=1 Tax=Cicer arietinum TaxID=3827 RepID=A0A3Q7YFU1_CICAR|nr:uncharacterized protein LOC101494924 [Cicer arietinum]
MKTIQRESFVHKYGKILNLLAVNVQTGALTALAQGNPYRYTGQPPKLDTIAEVLKIDIRELASTKEEKGAIHGFSRKYLEQKCQDLADKKEWSTFIDVLALIIYGIVIFPNLDNFVDFAAINVFLAFNKHKQNPVPAVLADVYYSMHMRHEKKGGTILCCVPVLYTWFVSHMFKKGYHVGVKSNREWAQGIASLTGDKISWYYREQEVEEDETIYWEERFMVLLGQLKNQEIYKELEDKGKHWKDCFSKLAMLANQIKAIEGYNVYGLEAFDMCLVPDVTIPAKFKVPDFEKYKGNTCPKNHLTMYCRKMASHAHNDKLLIHFFQDSLSGASLSWYMHLERNQIRSWKDLADAFLKQYRYNVDMAPDRMQLQNSLKNDNEAFKEYAQRWREMASQVEPPLSEREMVGMFMDTLPSPFFDKMIGSMSSNFSDLVMIGERIESGMRSGKIVCAATSVKRPQTTFTKKKEGDTNAVMVNPRISYFPPINSYRPPIFQPPIPQNPYTPYPYVAATTQASFPQYHPSRPPFYQPPPTAFSPEDNPNIRSNPLPGHENASVNAIEDGMDQYAIDDHVFTMGKPNAIIVETPIPFPYGNTKAVPWKYEVTSHLADHQPSDGCEPKGTEVTNISGIGGMTRSGRVYTPEQLRKKEVNGEKGKEDMYHTIKGQEISKKTVSEEEASEFLEFVKQSEYKVVDQLNQTPSKISVLSLLLNSEAHRRALMKVLNEAHVTRDIAVDQFDGVVGNITASSCLSFSDNELSAEGTEHNKALHISMRCHDHILARVLVDNGSSLNVMPKSTLSKLFVEGACLKPSALVVKAFDGSRRQVIGEIDLPIQIGPYIFGITFQVMDIKPAYSCLLGRPWIHAAGAVTSTLHQKLKFTVNNKLVIIYGEEDMIVSHLSSTGYIEDTEEAIETFFQALEIANVVFMGEGYRLKEPKQSTISLKSTKSMLEGGVFLNLGKLIEIPEKNNRYGLGYVPTQADEEKAAKEKRENKVTRRENWIPNSQKIPICDIRQNFQSAGIIYADQVAVAEEDHGDDDTLKLVYPCPPNTNLNNWKIIEFEDCEDDCELPPELESLIEREAKIIQPYQEPVEAINLGTGHDKKEVKVGMSMKESEREKLVKLLIDYVDVFAWSYQDMPGLDTNIVEHKLPLKPEYTPIKQKLRRMRPDMSLKIREEVKKQFDAGFLAVAKYPQWVANIVPVPKKDGKVRMCVDYRDLNKASPKDDFPLPHIDVLVDSTAQYSLFSFMDGFSGYNQIKMAPEDMEKTTFITQWGTFCYKVMPFGLKNAGATYQRAMVTLFHDMMHKEIEVYVDDMIAKSRTEEDHVVNLQKLFERLRKFKLRLNPAKCTFGVRSGKLLGFIVSQKGIEVDPDKVRAIQEMPAPRTEKEVRGFLGRLNYIARFISHLTATCEPIFKLLRKDQKVEWNENCQKAFEKIKQYLSKPPILVPPVPGKPLIMYLTVLDESMGCVLGQHDESGRKEHAIYYLSKKFTSCETRYSLLERTCCALAWAARRLRQYMLCHTTWLVSKMDPIKYIFEKPALTGRIARWQMLLSEYDLVYVTQKSIKGSALAEYLAHQPVEDYQSMQCEFPDEDIMNLVEEIESSDKEKWRLVFDGASNALGHGIGAILISPENQFTPFTARLCFDCTNNIAEYEACVMGIKAAIESNVKFLEVYGDSLLVIHQTKGDWETRDSKLIPYHTHIKELTEQFEKITFHHIPREENQLADALATLSSMFKITTNQDVPVIKIQQRDKPAYCLSIEEELDGKPWFYDIKSYVKNKEYPLGISENDKRVLRRLSMNFFLNGDVLYKRNHDMVLLRCVDKAEAGKIIQEVHEGSFGTHANGHTMARKILRAGYYWLTMESDCFSHVKKCHKCQIYADKIHVPPTSLNVLTSPWPFSMWGMDVIGLIEPKASNGHRFILVAIDYFTKWVEAASYANVTRSVVVRFIKRELICRYGLPNKIITDNATNLNNKMMKELCDNFKIQHHNSSPYRPKMNGAVEAANKNIKKIIQKMVETYKDWHEMLPFALHGYRTSVRTSTGATPFSLVYGMEAVLPIEVEIPSIKVLMETKLEEAEWVQSRYDQLNLIEEKRMIALCHGQLYQKRLKKAYEKKVRPREFREGELVLKKILPIKKDSRGKWTPNYEGPYVVKKAFSGGALILAEMDGDELPLPVNSDAVKKYYA